MDWAEHLKWVRKKNTEFIQSKDFCIFFTIEGWNSWNYFHCSINETVVRQTADAIVATGLAAAGYQYGWFFLYFTYTKHHLFIPIYSEYGRLLAMESRCSR